MMDRSSMSQNGNRGLEGSSQPLLQLEASIRQRESMLLETQQKLDLLKDDFQYNLKLIEARDKEIERLEEVVLGYRKRGEEMEEKIKSLSGKIEILQQKEVERQEKVEQDKLMYKRVLDELRNVIESMQWSHDEDIKSKNFQLDNFKAEVQAIQRSKEEALELQRRELTSTFEQIVHEREEAFQIKERDIAMQISMLDQKFEKIQSENLRLKSEAREVKLMNEKLLGDLSDKDNLIRRLQTDLTEVQKSKETMEDGLKRLNNSLQNQVQRLSDQYSREKAELQALVEKSNQEANREREFRGIVEQRLGDAQATAAAEIETLRTELSNLSKRQAVLLQEQDALRSEKDQLLQRLGTKRVEADSLVAQKQLLENDVNLSTERIQRTERELADLRAQLSTTQQEHAQYRADMEKRYNQLVQEGEEKLEAEEQRSREAIQRMESKYKTQLEIFKQEMDQERQNRETHFHRRMEEQEQDLHARLRSQQEEADEHVAALKRELTECKTEADAVKLRLKAQEQQILTLQQDLKQARLSTTIASNGPLPSVVAPPSRSATVQFSTEDLTLGDISLPSPMNSELNGLSWMGSPMQPSGSLPPPPPRFSTTPRTSHGEEDFVNSTRAIAENKARTEAIDTLTAENEKLKQFIREMRKDIEEVKQYSAWKEQEKQETKERSQEDSSPMQGGQLTLLEKRLEESSNEIMRLRNERKKLMETGNELRAALFKMENKKDAMEELKLEEARQENVNAIMDWIYTQPGQQGANPPAGGSSVYPPFTSPQMLSRNVWDTVSPHSRRAVGGIGSPAGQLAERAQYSEGSLLYPRENIEISGKGLSTTGQTQRTSRVSTNTVGNSERTTKSQMEALERLKERQRSNAQPRKVVNYAVQAAAEAAAQAATK
eukprot:gene2166-2365_t